MKLLRQGSLGWTLAALVTACGSADQITEATPAALQDASFDGSSPAPDAGFDSGAASWAPDASVGQPPPPAPASGCDSGLELIVRDFTEAHPDFEHKTGAVKGIVANQLGADKKPVYAPTGATAATTGKAEFDQWYRDVPGVNVRLAVTIKFTEMSPGVFVYDNSSFFPIDGMGQGNGPAKGINIPILGNLGGTPVHNFLFTTEAHTRFTYSGGERFTFRGDDDLWVFINNQLAVDLGGTHSALMESIDLDAAASRLGITIGQTYDMDIFHAERHTDESNYRIETTINLSCIENVPLK